MHDDDRIFYSTQLKQILFGNLNWKYNKCIASGIVRYKSVIKRQLIIYTITAI